MKFYRKIIFSSIMTMLLFALLLNIPYKSKYTLNTNTIEYLSNAKRDLLCLFLAYPDYISNIEKKDEYIYIILASGKKIIYDDFKVKDENAKLNNPDIQDMLEQIYPLEKTSTVLDKGIDPGRIRVYSLLNEVYGSSKNEIQSNIISTKAGYNYFQFNNNNKASQNLSLAMYEISSLIKTNPNIYPYVYPTCGTFNYRVISGTNRLSSHSFGIAIDLNSHKYDYWKWTTKENGNIRLSTYPNELVEIFEKHNFIWGGKWNHFDILHYEYRPEIILKAKYLANNISSSSWHDGFDTDTSTKYIELIDNVLNN